MRAEGLCNSMHTTFSTYGIYFTTKFCQFSPPTLLGEKLYPLHFPFYINHYIRQREKYVQKVAKYKTFSYTVFVQIRH